VLGDTKTSGVSYGPERITARGGAGARVAGSADSGPGTSAGFELFDIFRWFSCFVAESFSTASSL
jgi:hypothetical protein